MGRLKEPLMLGGEAFATIKAAEERYKQIKAASPKNVWLTNPFLLDVYNCNPHIPFQVTRILYRRHSVPRFGNWGVIAGGADGEETDREVSRRYAFGERSKQTINHRRLRLLVYPDVKDYREAMADALEPCHACGAEYSDSLNFDADHLIPFVRLVSSWLEENRLTHDSLNWLAAPGDQWFQIAAIDDRDLTGSWIAYHCQEVEWQWLCKPCHKKKSADER